MPIAVIRRGGPQPGSGRKPIGVTRKLVTLDPASIRLLKELGGGELSPGIRMAAKRIAKLKPIGTLTATQLEAMFPGLNAWADSVAIWAEQPQEDEA